MIIVTRVRQTQEKEGGLGTTSDDGDGRTEAQR